MSEAEIRALLSGKTILTRDIDRIVQAASAAGAIYRLAASGHGPTFTQRSVAIGQRAAIGTGENFDDFCAAILALEKTA